MFTKEDAIKIDKFIQEKFPIIYDFDFNAMVLVWGGGVKSVIMEGYAKDLDFIILADNDQKVIEFITKNNLEYTMNYFGGYKVTYNGFNIDLCHLVDLYRAETLSTGFILYDIHRKQFISLGIRNTIEKNILFVYYYKSLLDIRKRENKAKQFITYLNNKDKVLIVDDWTKPFRLFYAGIYIKLKILKKFLKELYYERKNRSNIK